MQIRKLIPSDGCTTGTFGAEAMAPVNGNVKLPVTGKLTGIAAPVPVLPEAAAVDVALNGESVVFEGVGPYIFAGALPNPAAIKPCPSTLEVVGTPVELPIVLALFTGMLIFTVSAGIS